MEIQLDVNNFMLDLERCKNKQEMRTVFEKYYPDKKERERMWLLMEKYRNNEEKVLKIKVRGNNKKIVAPLIRISLIFGFLTQSLLTNHVATGLALTIFGIGLLFFKHARFNKANSAACKCRSR